jgi:hypothetical protein
MTTATELIKIVDEVYSDGLIGQCWDYTREEPKHWIDRHEIGDTLAAFIAVELPSSKPTDHSVLTEQRDDESVARVIGFLRDKLGA